MVIPCVIMEARPHPQHRSSGQQRKRKNQRGKAKASNSVVDDRTSVASNEPPSTVPNLKVSLRATDGKRDIQFVERKFTRKPRRNPPPDDPRITELQAKTCALQQQVDIMHSALCEQHVALEAAYGIINTAAQRSGEQPGAPRARIELPAFVSTKAFLDLYSSITGTYIRTRSALRSAGGPANLPHVHKLPRSVSILSAAPTLNPSPQAPTPANKVPTPPLLSSGSVVAPVRAFGTSQHTMDSDDGLNVLAAAVASDAAGADEAPDAEADILYACVSYGTLTAGDAAVCDSLRTAGLLSDAAGNAAPELGALEESVCTILTTKLQNAPFILHIRDWTAGAESDLSAMNRLAVLVRAGTRAAQHATAIHEPRSTSAHRFGIVVSAEDAASLPTAIRCPLAALCPEIIIPVQQQG